MRKSYILLFEFFWLIALIEAEIIKNANFSREIPQPLGVNVHFTVAPAGEMEMLQNMGVKHMRMDTFWSNIEYTKGQYDFSQYDIFIANCLKYGVVPYMIIDYVNSFYDQGLAPFTDQGRDAFMNFAVAIVTRYKGKGIIWEIYNEPNLDQFWLPKKNVTNYCKLANKVVDAIKTRYPGEIVVGPATSGVDMNFLEEVFKSGLLHKLDAISVHPYGSDPPEEAIHKYDDLRLLMKQYGEPDKDILSGEWGFHTAQHTEKEQAQLIGRQWAVNAMKDIPISIWYDWHDGM